MPFVAADDEDADDSGTLPLARSNSGNAKDQTDKRRMWNI